MNNKKTNKIPTRVSETENPKQSLSRQEHPTFPHMIIINKTNTQIVTT